MLQGHVLSDRQATIAQFEDFLRTTNNRSGESCSGQAAGRTLVPLPRLVGAGYLVVHGTRRQY